MLNQILSHYKILSQLGEGGMGVVYKAEDLRLGRNVVLKFLAPHLTRDAQALERFSNEAKAASSLDHPNICTIYEIGETEDERMFIAMAYYEGETLQQRVTSGQLSVSSALEIATQIASGLECAHEAGITHRDIKPANIMITKRGEVKILDFGLAKLAGQSHLTKTGTTMGTVAYMSPEQAQGLPVDQRTDIWSLGVVLYEMLAGKLPFEGMYDQAILYAIVNVDHTPLTKQLPDATAHIAQVIDKALAKKPAERYQRVEDLLSELKAPAAPKARTQTHSKLSNLHKSISPKRLAWLSGILVLLAAMFFDVKYWLTPTQPHYDSIAVLPLQNLSGDAEQEYFADGMTEALIANLAKIKSLRVISRTSIMTYKNARKPLPEIAKELNVDAVVEGSVAREGNNVRVIAQLLDAQNDRHLWSGTYKHSLRDVLVLQSEVTEAIVGEIRVQLTAQEQQRLVSVRPVDPEAYQLYLKGRGYYNSFEFYRAVELYQQANAIDPNFAPAYASLAICYLNIRIGSMGGPPPRELFPRAKAAATKALELDKTLGEAHAALAAVRFFFEWDWHAPEQDYQRAVELEPQNTNILLMYDPYLILTGRFDEGIAIHRKAIELDPLSPFVSLTLGFGYRHARRYDEGIAYLRKMLQLYPNHPIALYQISWQYVLNGMYKEAIAAVEKGPEPAQRAYIYAVSGRRADALKVLEEVLDYSQREYFDPFYIAVIYMGLGDTEKTFQWLNKAYEERTGYMVWLKTEPVFDPIRADARYVELCRKIGLEE